jgi:hypothetical protein
MFYASDTGVLWLDNVSEWVSLSGGGGAAPGLVFAFLIDESKGYTESKGSSWESPLTFASSWLPVAPTGWSIVVSREGRGNNSEARLWDTTNNNELDRITWTSPSLQIVSSTSITNWPTSEALIEFQIRDNGKKGQIYSMRVA